MVTVKINGKEITVEDNTLILDAARDAGYEIPTFCYQADLMGIGSCRMCLVEIEGQKKLQPSCVTPVLHGISILTETPTVMSARASMLEFLLANHAMDCPVCDKGGECELQDMVYKYGPHKGRHAEPKFKFHEKDYALSPVIIKNSNRCVQCMKCVRVCREVVGRNVLGALGRGDHQEPTSFFRSFLDCDADGNCIEVCPVGCFMRLPYRYKTRPWDLKGADTICPYCATGCRMVIEHRDGEVIRARAQLGVGMNSETLCARGRFGYEIINSEARLTTPLVRRQRHGTLEPATWEEAFRIIKERMPSLGGNTVGGIAGARLATEELYLFQKLMREVFKTPNVDSGSRWDAAAVEGFIAATDMAEGGVSVFDCMEADTVFVIGSQVSEENPVTEYIIRRISAGRRMNVIIAGPRAMKLDSSANLLLRHYPAAEAALLSAVILDINAAKLAASADLTAAKDAKLDGHLKAAGLTIDDVRALATKLRNSESIAIMAGTEFLRYPHGIESLNLLKELLRSLGKKVRVMPLLDRSNQRGAWEMGVHPAFGPGYVKAPAPGLGISGMLDAAADNSMDALYIAGADPAALYPDEAHVKEALSKVRFLVVQDIFLTETARLADVVLPGASFAEKDGMLTNQEGRAQIIRKLLPPPGKAKVDLDIIRALGEMYDRSFGPKNAALVLDEIRRAQPMYADVSLAFNNKRNVDNKLDNKAALVKGTKAALTIRKFEQAASGQDAQYPFMLATGNHLFHSGRLTNYSKTLNDLMKGMTVEISEEDALASGLAAGERVLVSGAGFSVTLMLTVKKGTKRGVAFIAENFDAAPVNRFFRKGKGAPRVKITKA
ncbi:MAG: NADH-quinone oxidoreductase subunit NuoG [Deltaproteobacteria bacterium]|nr:NADH-quinone oxidoreductase subunit NuoG [Deltaproteobacteria bacterium]